MSSKKEQKKPTILDVANRAGVSVSVVSNVLNHPEKVAESTAKSVRKAMESIGWFPNIRRRGPKDSARHGVRTGNLVLLMMPNVPTRVFMNCPTNTELISSLIHEANALGFTLTVLDADLIHPFDPMLLKRLYDGIIVYGEPGTKKGTEVLVEISRLVPMVWIRSKGNLSSDVVCDFVYYDNSIVGHIAANYFYGRGHKNAAVFSASQIHAEYNARVDVFTKHANSLGIEVDKFLPALPEPNKAKRPCWDIYREQAENFLKTSQAKALFFCSDDDLLGVTNELRAMGVDLDQYDLLSCNHNSYLLQYFKKPPLSIDICFTQVGSESIHHLLRIINDRVVRSQSEFLVQPRLME